MTHTFINIIAGGQNPSTTANDDKRTNNAYWNYIMKDHLWFVVCSFVSKVKQSLYTPWRRLGGEEV
jgi:hypothetical protein